MFCPKCGAQLPDGSNFCSSCGAMLDSKPAVTAQEEPAAASPAPQYAAQESPAPAQYAAQENPAPAQYAAQENPAPVQYEAQGNPVPQYGAQPAPAAAGNGGAAIMSGIKKIPVKFIAIGAGALAAIIIIIIIIASLAGGGKPANAYVYLSDGTFSLITNIHSDEYPEIDSVRYSKTSSNLLQFSEDGRYLYYYSKLDDSGSTGTLCRAEYGRLGLNASDNEKYIEVISKNAKLGSPVTTNGGLLYLNGNNDLYYYNGTESQKIASSIYDFSGDDKGRVIYATSSGLYGVELNDIDGKKKLTSKVTTLYDMDKSDFDNIIYECQNDDGTFDLRVVGFNRDDEKVAEDVNIVDMGEGGVVYYLTDGGKTLLAYDYIVDEYASQDAGITRPDEDDYRVPNYRYDALDTYNSADNYDGIYLSLTEDVYFCYHRYYNDYSNLYNNYYWYYRFYDYDPEYADERGMTNLAKWDAVYEYYDNFSYDYSLEYASAHDPLFYSEYSAFINKYKSQADEDGYILVTDAIKKELNDLAYTCRNFSALFKEGEYTVPERDENAWLSFCYGKYESGYTIDDKYYEDLNKYYEVADRIEMRDTLKNDESYRANVSTLYRYENGTSEVIIENVLDYEWIGGALSLNTADSITKKINIDDLYWAYDAMAVFKYDYENNNPFVLSDSGKQVHMSDSAFKDYLKICCEKDGRVQFTENRVYIYNVIDGLYVANINGDTIEAFELVEGDAKVDRIVTETETAYYFTDIDGDYGTLCSYDGKESKVIAKNVLAISYSCKYYEDGVIIAYTDYSYASGEVSVIDAGGSMTAMADDVVYYIRVDSSNLLYVTDDGDLYHFDGSNKTRLAYDVDWVWSLNVMEPIF